MAIVLNLIYLKLSYPFIGSRKILFLINPMDAEMWGLGNLKKSNNQKPMLKIKTIVILTATGMFKHILYTSI